jgi:hypothetical protein
MKVLCAIQKVMFALGGCVLYKKVSSFICTYSIIRGYCIQSIVLRQVHSLFQSPFTTECDLVLPLVLRQVIVYPKARSQQSASYCFLFKFPVSWHFLKFTQWLLTSSSLPSRYFNLATFPAVACYKTVGSTQGVANAVKPFFMCRMYFSSMDCLSLFLTRS